MSNAAPAIDGRAVPRARDDVAAVVLDGEAVIYAGGRVHLLDPVATLVWRCCDGSASVARIAADLAGAFATAPDTVLRDVTAVVEALDARDLLEPGAPAPPRRDPVELIVDPPGACAACAERPWPMRRTFRIGNRLLSVGTDLAHADAAIAGALRAHLVDMPTELATEPPFLAVELHGRDGAVGPQRLDLLLRGDAVAARSRHPDRIVDALAAHLASYGDLAALGLAAVNGVVVGRADRVMIVTEPRDPVRFRHALARAGVHVADQPVAFVDAVRGEVVVGAPGITLDRSSIDALGGETAGGEPAPLPWGRYRLDAFGVPTPASATAALLAFGPRAGDHRDEASTVDALCALLATIPVTDAVTPDAIDARLRGR